MPKRTRREQQHLNQRPQRARARSTTGGQIGSPDQYKAGFPMNLLQNARLFYIIGAVIMIGSIILAVILQSNAPADQSVADLTGTAEAQTPTPTTDPNATPTTEPSVSPTIQRTFTQAEQVLDPNEDYFAIIKTDKGDIEMDLFEDEAPQTVNTFVFLAEKGYFNGLTFHRVEPNFVVQGGDPQGDGTGGPGFQTPEDKNDLTNTRGMVSMAKSGTAEEFGSQFFINLKDNPALDRDGAAYKRFFPWAEVTEGMDIVEQIAEGDVMNEVVIETR